MTEPTIKCLLQKAEQALSDVSDSAKLDAEILLCFVLNKPRSYLLTWPEKQLSSVQLEQVNQLLARREQGEPVAYLVGEKEFWSLQLNVSPATLIPRPDTETLVELVLNHHQDNVQESQPNKPLRCLDLGTGTGAIALALASEQPNWQIEAVDFNHDAVLLAKGNAKKHQLEQVNIYQSDWFSAVPEQQAFDVIVSNPPYIEENDHHLSQGDVRYEPLSALIAADDGLADIKHIAQQARNYLAQGGMLYFEHGYQQGQAVRDILSQYGYQQPKTVQDLAGNDRITFANY